VLAPDPVEAFLRHPQRNDDVDPVAVVLLGGVLERGRDAVPTRRVVVDEVGDPKDAAVGELDELKARLGIYPLPFTCGKSTLPRLSTRNRPSKRGE
jgi:hypothetical protein